MKVIVHIVFVLTCSTLFAQDWRDTLDMAREAYKGEEYGKSYEYYESAQKGAPENVDLSDEMAQSAYKARKFEQAEKIYQQNDANKTSEAKKAENYHNLGNARMKQKNYQGAIEAYKESIRRNPNDDQTRYNLSEAIRKLKKQQQQQDQQQQDKNQDNNQNDQEGDQGEQGDKGDQQNQGEKGDQQDKGDQQSGNSQNQSGGDQESDQEGRLKNKMVDRMLDELMKDEAETKRKMYGNRGRKTTPKSGKDW